jgi:hypothetical protein
MRTITLYDCAVCGIEMTEDEMTEAVWTCPADCGTDEPGWEPMVADITEEMREEAGVFSNCGHDYGQDCYDEVPMHSACYDTRFVVVAS